MDAVEQLPLFERNLFARHAVSQWPYRLVAHSRRSGERRRLEEFVQSLDHLRVTLCTTGPGGAAARRCVMITSAVGGEGKTTLAAQLAGRCANAGLTTLLVDADFRSARRGNRDVRRLSLDVSQPDPGRGPIYPDDYRPRRPGDPMGPIPQ